MKFRALQIACLMGVLVASFPCHASDLNLEKDYESTSAGNNSAAGKWHIKGKITVESQNGDIKPQGELYIYRIDDAIPNTELKSGRGFALWATTWKPNPRWPTSYTGDVTIEGNSLTTSGIVQADTKGQISFDVNSYAAKTNDHLADGTSLVRAGPDGQVTIHARDIAINPDDRSGFGGVSAFGGMMIIVGDNISINGNIYSGTEEGKSDLKEESTILIRRTNNDTGATVIKGDVMTYNDSKTQNQVFLYLNNASSLLEGAVKNLDEEKHLAALSRDHTGTTLSLSGGATWNMTGDSTVNKIESDQSILNTGAYNLQIKTLTSGEKGTSINTSSGRAGKIAIETLANTGTVSLNLDHRAASELEGKSEEEIAQNAANVLKIGTDSNKTGYRINIAEGEIYGAIHARADENGKIIPPQEDENTVMSSLMNISANNFLVFRSQMNDLDKRMGDLRTMPQASGMWARAIAGQSEYKQIHNTYQTLQIGADKRIGNIYVGGTASYTDGDGKLDNGSTDDKNYSFGIYGGWINGDGQYIDVIAKRHHTESEYDLAYTSGDRAKGSMDTSGTSLSVEYGWRLGIADTDFYIEPQAELMYGHLNSVGYTTSNGVRISQDAIKTAVGRLGIAAGWVSPDKTGSAYIKASVLHDWEGEAEIRAAKGNTSRSFTEDMGGTWGEFALGGTWNISKNLAAYGEVETTAGNPVRTTYQASGGIRYSF